MLAVGLSAGLLCAPVVRAGTYNWTFQEFGYAGDYASGLAMRTNNTWPVVFSQNRSSSYTVAAYSLKPVGWTSASFSSTVYGNSAIKAEAAPNGEVGATWSSGSTIEFAGSSANGWVRKSFTRTSGDEYPDLAFLPDSNPLLAYAEGGRLKVAGYNSAGWSQASVDAMKDPATGSTTTVSARRVSVAADSEGGVFVAFTNGPTVGVTYFDSITGTWLGKMLTNMSTSTISDISLAFGPNNEAGMALRTDDRRLLYAAYDPRTGTWSTDVISTDVLNYHVNLVFDHHGNPSVAYQTQAGISFSTNPGEGWTTSVLPVGNYKPMSYSDAALAFDADNLPVIAFNAGSGKMILAYDPVLVPEPACFVLLVGGVMALIGRRRAV
jgi:hypothetical protein